MPYFWDQHDGSNCPLIKNNWGGQNFLSPLQQKCLYSQRQFSLNFPQFPQFSTIFLMASRCQLSPPQPGQADGTHNPGLATEAWKSGHVCLGRIPDGRCGPLVSNTSPLCTFGLPTHIQPTPQCTPPPSRKCCKCNVLAPCRWLRFASELSGFFPATVFPKVRRIIDALIYPGIALRNGKLPTIWKFAWPSSAAWVGQLHNDRIEWLPASSR